MEKGGGYVSLGEFHESGPREFVRTGVADLFIGGRNNRAERWIKRPPSAKGHIKCERL